MYRPLITIITSTYNSAETLSLTMDSIVKQSYTNLQFIIADGQSSDQTIEIAKQYQAKFEDAEIDFNWFSEKDTGVYQAWNKALKYAKGEWIVFCGSDDYFKSDTHFEDLLDDLNQAKRNKSHFVYGIVEHINFENEVFEYSGKPWAMQEQGFFKTMNLPHTGSFHHKSLFENYGQFNEDFKIVGDYEFLLRAFTNKNEYPTFIEKVFVVMREGGVSASLENRLLIVKENKLARKLNGIHSISWPILFWELRVRFVLLISKIFGKNTGSKLADLYRRVILGKEKRWSS